jgi:hypothetical protein
MKIRRLKGVSGAVPKGPEVEQCSWFCLTDCSNDSRYEEASTTTDTDIRWCTNGGSYPKSQPWILLQLIETMFSCLRMSASSFIRKAYDRNALVSRPTDYNVDI